ncbi:hypothetical protein JB92DRAFT_3150503 [Gautieria morchelliformis]|nr:hypothetical protein JB92DRAFT_3150503 [Gautieria morchelliformis]
MSFIHAVGELCAPAGKVSVTPTTCHIFFNLFQHPTSSTQVPPPKQSATRPPNPTAATLVPLVDLLSQPFHLPQTLEFPTSRFSSTPSLDRDRIVPSDSFSKFCRAPRASMATNFRIVQYQSAPKWSIHRSPPACPSMTPQSRCLYRRFTNHVSRKPNPTTSKPHTQHKSQTSKDCDKYTWWQHHKPYFHPPNAPSKPLPVKISQIGDGEANGRDKFLTKFDARRSCPIPNLHASDSSLGACYVKPLAVGVTAQEAENISTFHGRHFAGRFRYIC